jgi:hypothetical protein
MKALKIYLMVMGGLFTLAILIGVGVWFLYQDLPGANPTRYTENVPFKVNESKDVQVDTAPGTPTTETVIYTITPDSLSEGQRAVLESFGMGGGAFEVTQPMIDCVTESVGDKRFSEILGGSAPTPLEALAFLPCIKK